MGNFNVFQRTCCDARGWLAVRSQPALRHETVFFRHRPLPKQTTARAAPKLAPRWRPQQFSPLEGLWLSKNTDSTLGTCGKETASWPVRGLRRAKQWWDPTLDGEGRIPWSRRARLHTLRRRSATKLSISAPCCRVPVQWKRPEARLT